MGRREEGEARDLGWEAREGGKDGGEGWRGRGEGGMESREGRAGEGRGGEEREAAREGPEWTSGALTAFSLGPLPPSFPQAPPSFPRSHPFLSPSRTSGSLPPSSPPSLPLILLKLYNVLAGYPASLGRKGVRKGGEAYLAYFHIIQALLWHVHVNPLTCTCQRSAWMMPNMPL